LASCEGGDFGIQNYPIGRNENRPTALVEEIGFSEGTRGGISFLKGVGVGPRCNWQRRIRVDREKEG